MSSPASMGTHQGLFQVCRICVTGDQNEMFACILAGKTGPWVQGTIIDYDCFEAQHFTKSRLVVGDHLVSHAGKDGNEFT